MNQEEPTTGATNIISTYKDDSIEGKESHHREDRINR